MTHIFISYSRRNLTEAKNLVRFLRERGFSTWRDEDDLEPGGEWAVDLELSIRGADVVVALISSESRSSRMVNTELIFALDHNKNVIPFMLEDVEPPLPVYALQRILGFQNWKKACEDLDAFLKKLPPVSPHQPEITKAAVNESLSSPSVNPFGSVGTMVSVDNFAGRISALSFIASRLGGDSLASVSLVGQRRMGKTSLMNYLMKRHMSILPSSHRFAFAYLDMSTTNARTISGFMAVLREGVKEWTEIQLWDPADDGNLDIMTGVFAHLAQQGVRLVLCLDEFESALTFTEALYPLFSNLRASGSAGHLSMITATRRPIADLMAEWGVTSPFANIFLSERLNRMPEDEWHPLIIHAFERGGAQITPDQIAIIGDLAAGHPYLTQIAGFYAWETRTLRWVQAEARIRERFADQAEPYFRDLYERQNHITQASIQQFAGLPIDAPVPGAKKRLRDMGILNDTEDGLFCQPFVTFLLEELG